MPARSKTTNKYILKVAREVVDSFEARYDATSHIAHDDLNFISHRLRTLGLTSCAGRTIESYDAEWAYRYRAFFTSKRTFTATATSRTPQQAEYFGRSDTSFDSTFGGRYELSLTSLSINNVLTMGFRTSNDAVDSNRSFGISARFNSMTGMSSPTFTTRTMKKGATYFLKPTYRTRSMEPYRAMTIEMAERYGIEGMWGALERIWCELLIRQRPHRYPLRRVNVEARIRALTGRTVWIEHTQGVSIGRCPDIRVLLSDNVLELDTSMSTIGIDPTKVLEIAPWNASYGVSLIAARS